MEDNELQELFAAKRTTEANRRRQAELRQLIEARGARRSRPLWPVWTGAAAAAVALLLLIRPLIQPSAEGDGPVLVAQTEVPTSLPETVGETDRPTLPSATARPQAKPATAAAPGKGQAMETPDTPEPSAPPADQAIPESPAPVPAVEEAAEPAVEQQIVAPAPRVMRRQSTLLACTEGCKTPEGETAGRRLDINMGSNDPDNSVFYSLAIK